MNLDDLSLDKRTGLPDALRVLMQDYPREAWTTDPGFSDLVRFWLERHLMFRRLVDLMAGEVEDAMDNTLDPQIFASHLSRYGAFFMQELHAHHTIEDTQYFPRLRQMDERLGWGFDLLDRDHHAIDAHLNGFAEDTNALLLKVQGQADFRPALDAFEQRLAGSRRLLDRHLTDEEELIVPVILKHAPSGVV